MSEWQTLVSTDYEGGTAAVSRDEDGDPVLMGDVKWRCGTVLDDFRGAIAIPTEDRTVQGGLLPPGASGAEVVDDRGVRNPAAAANGAWVVVLGQTSHDTSPVRFYDAVGSTVATPLPEGWRRTPVEDAEDPCPACGTCAWDELHPLDGSRGTGGTDGPCEELTPFVFCRECGHEESIGTFYGAMAPEDVDPEEVARRVREHELERQTKAREALGTASFRIYAAAGWPAEATGWGWGMRWPEDLHSIRISHGAWNEQSGATLTVETEVEEELIDSELAEARHLLEVNLGETIGDWPDLSEAALTIWLEARDRERRRIAADAIPELRLVDVDEEPREFLVVQADARWAAVSRLDTVVVKVTGRDVPVEDLRLEALSDPVSIVED